MIGQQKILHHYTAQMIQSNRFPINQIISKFRCSVLISVETRTLSYFTISKFRESRKDKILELQTLGLNTVEIAKEMNKMGIKSPRGRLYTPKLIWVTIKKWRLREDRMKDCRVTINSIEPVITIPN